MKRLKPAQSSTINIHQNMPDLLEKIKQHRAQATDVRQKSNLSVNPELRNLVFRTNKVLSVANFPIR